jgi:sRNA-binding regulator protein Hfq
MTNWKQILNSGQRNCGIYIDKINPNIIIKCNYKNTKIKEVVEINSKIQLFPKIYNECTDDNNYEYVVMQKLDGDLTSIFFDLLPRLVIPQLNVDMQTKLQIYELFLLKIRKSRNHTKISMTNFEQLMNNIDKNSNFTVSIYDEFITNLIAQWNILFPVVTKEIIRLCYELSKLSYVFHDFKLDNFGYKLESKLIDNDFRNKDIIKLFEKYFYIYFLDWDSGLFLISEANDLKNYYKKLTMYYNSGFSSLSAYGQFNITVINSSIKYIWNGTKFEDVNLMSYSDKIKTLSNKIYNFPLDNFKHISNEFKYVISEINL